MWPLPAFRPRGGNRENFQWRELPSYKPLSRCMMRPRNLRISSYVRVTGKIVETNHRASHFFFCFWIVFKIVYLIHRSLFISLFDWFRFFKNTDFKKYPVLLNYIKHIKVCFYENCLILLIYNLLDILKFNLLFYYYHPFLFIQYKMFILANNIL